MSKSKNILYRVIRALGKPVFGIIYRPKIIGSSNIPVVEGAVIAGNHKHAFDPILIDICTKRIVHTLAKKELHDGKFGFIFRSVGTIPVDLHSKENRQALYMAIEMLKDNHLVNVSPEAKRNYSNELLLPFKYGAVSMAQKTGVPIIPYAITGEYKLFSKNLTVIFGEPIYVNEEELYEANKFLYDSIKKLLIAVMDEKELKSKHITSFDEWSKFNV